MAWEHYGPHGCQHSIGGYIESGDGEICDVSGFDVGSEMAFKNAKMASRSIRHRLMKLEKEKAVEKVRLWHSLRMLGANHQIIHRKYETTNSATNQRQS